MSSSTTASVLSGSTVESAINGVAAEAHPAEVSVPHSAQSATASQNDEISSRTSESGSSNSSPNFSAKPIPRWRLDAIADGEFHFGLLLESFNLDSTSAELDGRKRCNVCKLTALTPKL